ncbi:MAG: hypothetical protein LBV43_06655 [Prevotella sp.]|jgi:hypothetical protein|nr:hypothetical protein [Prevotella sp.]
MKKKIESSIIATGGGSVSNSNINIKSVQKKSFWKGFLSGIISSLIASGIWYLLNEYVIN